MLDEPGSLRMLRTVHVGAFARVALLADVHGNVAALAGVLDEIRGAVDAVCFLGCLTWGPAPVEVLSMAAGVKVPAYFLRGNGERAVLELAAGVREREHPSDDWMVQAHGADGLTRLGRFPEALTVTVPGGRNARLCHGSPRSDVELLTPESSPDRLSAACRGVAEPIVVHGHTHLQYQRTVAGRVVAGCGSVGLPYTDGPAAAFWTMLDADGVHPRRTEYDVTAAIRAIRAGTYPSAERYLESLLRPPRPADIILDAESKLFSD